MRNQSNQPRSSGITTADALGLLFVALKLCGVIAWSWWWVTAPFWIEFILRVLVACARKADA